MVRRFVWSRNLKDQEAMARVGSQRHKEKCASLHCYVFSKTVFVMLFKYCIVRRGWWDILLSVEQPIQLTLCSH